MPCVKVILCGNALVLPTIGEITCETRHLHIFENSSFSNQRRDPPLGSPIQDFQDFCASYICRKVVTFSLGSNFNDDFIPYYSSTARQFPNVVLVQLVEALCEKFTCLKEIICSPRLVFFTFPMRIFYILRRILFSGLRYIFCLTRRSLLFLMSMKWAHDADILRGVVRPYAPQGLVFSYSQGGFIRVLFIALLYHFALEMLSLEECTFLAKPATFLAKCVAFLLKCVVRLNSLLLLQLLLSFVYSRKTLQASYTILLYSYSPLWQQTHCASRLVCLSLHSTPQVLAVIVDLILQVFSSKTPL